MRILFALVLISSLGLSHAPAIAGGNRDLRLDQMQDAIDTERTRRQAIKQIDQQRQRDRKQEGEPDAKRENHKKNENPEGRPARRVDRGTSADR